MEETDVVAYWASILRAGFLVRAPVKRVFQMRAAKIRGWGMVLLVLACPAIGAEPPPLQMGVLPYLSSEGLFKNFLPMKQYIEASLGRRVIMSTAPNFKTYIQRAARGDYDIYQTAPHFALLAETESGYRRVGRFTRELSGDVVVRRDASVRRIEDLRGRIVISPDALAITSLLGEQLLQEHGLLPGRDYRIVRSASHNNAVLTVYRRQAAAAFTSAAVFEHLPPDIRRELRVLTKTREVPHMMVMANPRLSQSEYEHLQSSLLAFTRTGAGRIFFETTGYGGMVPISDLDMERLRPFLQHLKEHVR